MMPMAQGLKGLRCIARERCGGGETLPPSPPPGGPPHKKQAHGAALVDLSPSRRTPVPADTEERMLRWQQLGYILRLQRWWRRRLSVRAVRERIAERKLAFEREFEASNARIIQKWWRSSSAIRIVSK